MKRVFAFIGFSMAITLIVLNTVAYSFAKYILIAAALAFAVSMLVKKLRQEKVVPVTLGAVLFSCLVFIICMQSSVLPQKTLDGETAAAVFEIVDMETEDEDSWLYTVKTKFIDVSGSPQNIRLKLRSKAKINADYYEEISGVLAFYSYTDSAFDSYGDYGNNIFIRASLISYEPTEDNSKPLNYYILQIRLKIKDILTENLDEEKAGLALSILTGDRRMLSDRINESFMTCGLSHLVAVSGMNMSVICFCFYYLLRLIKIGRLPSTAVTLLAVFLYSGVSGYSKSVLRSAIMISVMLIARLINNKADTMNSLGFSVFLICLNPFSVTDPSAVLTVTAVIGLSVVKPEYDKWLRPENSILKYLYDGLFAGISVMITTIPAIWLFFGKVSLISLFANILCVPVMEVALVFILLLCLFSGVPFFADALCFFSSFFTGALIEIAAFFAERFKFLYVNISDSLFGVAISGILLLAAVSLLINSKISMKLISLFTAIAFMVCAAFSFYDYTRNAYLTVLSSGGIMVYDRDAALLIDFDDNSDCYALENTVGSSGFEKVTAVNSSGCRKAITGVFPDAEFISYDDATADLCAHIGMDYVGGVLSVSIHNNVFKIDGDYVTINEYKTYRNIYDRFSEKDNVTFIITSDAQMQIRKG